MTGVGSATGRRVSGTTGPVERDAAAAVAGRGVRHRAHAHAAGGPVCAGDGALQPVPVPARFIGHRVRVKLSASRLVFDRTTVVARHSAFGRQGRESPRPGSLPGDLAAQARRAAGRDRACPGPRRRRVHCDARRVLGRGPQSIRRQRRHAGAGRGVATAPPPRARRSVVAGISAALSVGSVNADVVAVEARKAARQRGASAPPVEATPRRQQVVSLTERRLDRSAR